MTLDRDGLDEFATILPSAQRSPEGPCYPTPTGSVVVDVDWRGGYELFTKYGNSADDVGLHVFSIYEVRDDHRAGRHPEGEATIEVEFPGEHDLVLSSYEPVHWQVSTGEDTSLRHITVYGYHTQRVSAPEGVKVDIYSDEGGTGAGVYCGYSIPYDGGGCDTDKLLDQIEDDAGRPVSSFHGTYRAATFELRDTHCPLE